MFAIKPMKKALAMALGGSLSSTLLLAMPAFAQTADTTPQKIDKVVVTGSAIKRIDAETALPVQVVTKEDIARTGVSSVEQLLQTISATSALGSTTVAGTGPGGGQGGGGSASTISLRGLGSQRTLVLINGRRSAPAGGLSAVDIANIPLAAIERVEILKDGASSLYGSDAVAGVVNFILRKDFTGTEFSATFGAPTRSGGGNEYKVSALTGIGDIEKSRYSVTFGGSYSQIKPIFGADRSFARNINVGEGLNKTSATAFPANILLPNLSTVRAGPTYPNCGPYSFVSGTLCRYDNSVYDALQPDIKQASVILNGRLKITSNIEGYVDSNFTRNKTLNTVQHVLFNGSALPPGSPYITTLTNLVNAYPGFKSQFTAGGLTTFENSGYALLQPSSPYYPTAYAATIGQAGQPLILLFRSVPTGLRKTEDTTDNARIVTGVRGNAFGWDYDSAFLFSQNKLTERLVNGWPDFNKYLTLVDSGVINPFGQTNDPNALAAAQATNYNGLWFTSKTSVTSVDLKGSREIFQLPAGAVGLAAGLEFRREKLDITPSDANANFLVGGFGSAGVPVSAKRNVESVYVELNIPILKTLEGNIATRYDNYQRVGNTVNPKASMRWVPTDTFLVRAAIGTGFRAPTLNDLYQPAAKGITTNGQRDPVRCPVPNGPQVDCNNQYVTIGGGNPALKPEKSKTTTLGFVFEPSKQFSLGLDFWMVQIKDVIRTGVPVKTILADQAKYGNYVFRGPFDGDPSGVGPIIGIDQSLTNLGKTNVSGIDLDIKGKVLNTAENKVTLRLNGTYFTRYDQQNLDGTYTSSINNSAVTSAGIGVVLRWRHTASAIWETGAWATTLSENFQVGYPDARTLATIPQREVAPYETYDAQVSYAGFRQLRLTLGVKNLFDQNPPYTNYGGGFVGSYDLSYSDVRGRFAYVTATYSFK